ncbi:MAG: GntR family transcriptional regulator [Chloroflexota bacterium]
MNTNRFLPRYLKFAHQIQAQINAGTLSPGDKLPSQKELAEQFNTTLMTIRKAIQVLVDDGILQSEHGVGTFVADPNLQEEQFQLFSLSDELHRRPTGNVETKIVGVKTAVFIPSACQVLRLPEETAVVLLERLRIRNGTPFAYQRSFLPNQFLHVANQIQPNTSLYSALQKAIGQNLTMAKELLQPIVLAEKEAVLLQTKAGQPAWLSYRISFNQGGQPILYDEAILKQDSFVMTVEHFGKRTKSQLKMLDEYSPDIFSFLLEE